MGKLAVPTRPRRTTHSWTDHLVLSLRSDNTRRNYRAAIRALQSDFPAFSGRESEQVLLRHVRRLQSQGLAPQSLRQRVGILKAIYNEAQRVGLRRDNPVRGDWCPQIRIEAPPRCPSRAELEQLDGVLKDISGFVGARDRAIVGLFRLEGLRIAEVAALRHDDLQLDSSPIMLCVRGKGGFVTTIELWKQSTTLLRAYLKWLPKPMHTGPLFIPAFAPGTGMDVRAIRKRFEQYAKRAHWRRGLGPHSLRHALAVTLLENGVPLTEVQRKLRHRFLQTTFHYYQNVPSMRNAAPMREAQKIICMKF